jgi:hypothetical protein
VIAFQVSAVWSHADVRKSWHLRSHEIRTDDIRQLAALQLSRSSFFKEKMLKAA